jgi:hypothetical protein
MHKLVKNFCIIDDEDYEMSVTIPRIELIKLEQELPPSLVF